MKTVIFVSKLFLVEIILTAILLSFMAFTASLAIYLIVIFHIAELYLAIIFGGIVYYFGGKLLTKIIDEY